MAGFVEDHVIASCQDCHSRRCRPNIVRCRVHVKFVKLSFLFVMSCVVMQDIAIWSLHKLILYQSCICHKYPMRCTVQSRKLNRACRIIWSSVNSYNLEWRGAWSLLKWTITWPAGLHSSSMCVRNSTLAVVCSNGCLGGYKTVECPAMEKVMACRHVWLWTARLKLDGHIRTGFGVPNLGLILSSPRHAAMRRLMGHCLMGKMLSLVIVSLHRKFTTPGLVHRPLLCYWSQATFSPSIQYSISMVS